MKGLLLKDLALIKNQSQAFIIVAAIALFMMLAGNDVIFIISYAIILFAMFGITTLNYDHFDNGFAFLFTLPITRKLYVLEKYIFSMLCTVVGAGVALLMIFVGSFIRSEYALVSSDISFLVGYVLSAMIFLALVLPIQIKFGPEKGRIAMLVLFMLIMALGTGLKSVVEDEKVVELFAKLSSLAPVLLLGTLAVLAIVMLGISYMISCKIMMKKEF